MKFSNMYSTWSVKNLKEELNKRGALLRGRKTDLVQRLESYDKNFNFGNTEVLKNDEPAIKLPLNESYRDINSNTSLPPLNKTQIRQYLHFTNKKMKNVMQLYESRHLVTARSCISNGYTYIKGICRKTMKNLHYEVNIKLDYMGNIVEAHCECPAGSGNSATCKHVAVLLLGVEHMVSGKIMLLFQACTQRLQRFHAPRNPYAGTPVRVEKLSRKKNISSIIFEPYPVHKINKQNYNCRVRNLVLNFPNSSMPIKQMYEPAYPYALVSDHNYSLSDPEAQVLQNLQLSKITEEQIQQIEKTTREQSSNTKWHNERQKRLTASNFHTICHLKDTTMKSFAKQLQQMRPFQSRATSHGLINEKIALKKYCEMNDLLVEPSGLFVSEERPYLAASPDALLGPDTIIEIKCPYASRFQEIHTTTVPYLITVNGELSLKTSSPYYYQVQGQLYCTNRKYCNFIVYTFIDLKVIYVYKDEAFIKIMLSKLDNFYENCFKEELLKKHLYYNYHNFSIKN